jgi:hypothetical protein
MGLPFLEAVGSRAAGNAVATPTRQATELREAHLSLRAAPTALGVSRSVVHRWRRLSRKPQKPVAIYPEILSVFDGPGMTAGVTQTI